MIRIPAFLKEGDTIGIVCPAGYMPAEKAATCITVLEEAGYQVKVGKTLGNQFHYFSGTDAERLADLQEMLDDTTVKAILFGRGGYGMSRIIDALDFTKYNEYPKWLIGFSDITVLHAHVHQLYRVATLHAPMAAAFNDEAGANDYIQSLLKTIRGEKVTYHCAPHAYNRTGQAAGELVGGNLSIVAHLVGSRSAYDTRGKILFLEDIGEYIYNIDRMMIQLKRSGALDQLAGLIIGGFSEMKDTLIPFGQEVDAIIRDHAQEYAYPVCYNFPVSHEKENYALKIGGQYELIVDETMTRLKE